MLFLVVFHTLFLLLLLFVCLFFLFLVIGFFLFLLLMSFFFFDSGVFFFLLLVDLQARLPTPSPSIDHVCISEEDLRILVFSKKKTLCRECWESSSFWVLLWTVVECVSFSLLLF